MVIPSTAEFTVMGIDQSLSGSGIAVVQARPGTELLMRIHTETISPKDIVGIPRLDFISKQVVALAEKFKPTILCMEDVTRMASSAAIIPLVELYAAIKLDLWRGGFSVVIQNQSSMKKFNFGVGNVSKDSAYMLKVMDAVNERFEDDNQADAFLHARLGAYTVWLARGDIKLSEISASKREVFLAKALKASKLTRKKFSQLSSDEQMALALKLLA